MNGVCPSCPINPLSVSACRCVFPNTGLGKELLQAYKARRLRAYAPVLAALAAERLGNWVRSHELLVPVPIARSALWERDFCPVTVPVQALSRRTGVPWAAALEKTRAGSTQHFLGRSGRRLNAQEKFAARPARVPPGLKRILIVDDILTTGSTLNEAAAALRRALPGVELGALAFARTPLRGA